MASTPSIDDLQRSMADLLAKIPILERLLDTMSSWAMDEQYARSMRDLVEKIPNLARDLNSMSSDSISADSVKRMKASIQHRHEQLEKAVLQEVNLRMNAIPSLDEKEGQERDELLKQLAATVIGEYGIKYTVTEVALTCNKNTFNQLLEEIGMTNLQACIATELKAEMSCGQVDRFMDSFRLLIDKRFELRGKNTQGLELADLGLDNPVTALAFLDRQLSWSEDQLKVLYTFMKTYTEERLKRLGDTSLLKFATSTQLLIFYGLQACNLKLLEKWMRLYPEINSTWNHLWRLENRTIEDDIKLRRLVTLMWLRKSELSPELGLGVIIAL